MKSMMSALIVAVARCGCCATTAVATASIMFTSWIHSITTPRRLSAANDATGKAAGWCV
jgi:hypothetical protein